MGQEFLFVLVLLSSRWIIYTLRWIHTKRAKRCYNVAVTFGVYVVRVQQKGKLQCYMHFQILSVYQKYSVCLVCLVWTAIITRQYSIVFATHFHFFFKRLIMLKQVKNCYDNVAAAFLHRCARARKWWWLGLKYNCFIYYYKAKASTNNYTW